MKVSEDTEVTTFFQGVFDFKPVSDVTVTGADYDALQGVFNSRIRIVTLRLGQETVRLMECISPNGCLILVDSKSNDLVHVQLVSPQPVRLSDAPLRRGLLIRDPDGHNLMLVEP